MLLLEVAAASVSREAALSHDAGYTMIICRNLGGWVKRILLIVEIKMVIF